MRMLLLSVLIGSVSLGSLAARERFACHMNALTSAERARHQDLSGTLLAASVLNQRSAYTLSRSIVIRPLPAYGAVMLISISSPLLYWARDVEGESGDAAEAEAPIRARFYVRPSRSKPA